MPTSEVIQKLAFEGPLSVGQLVGLGLAVGAIMGLFAWRECRTGGSLKLFAFLLPLRLGALAVILWMLAGATLTKSLRSETPRSVVFLVDSSPSMGLIDPVDGSGNTLDWSLAQSEGKTEPAIASIEQAVGSLRAAESALHQIRILNAGSDPEASPQPFWRQAWQSIESAAAELGRVKLDTSRADADSAAELSRLVTFLKAGVSSLKSETLGSTRRSRGARQAQDDRLESADNLVEAGARRADHLAQNLLVRYERSPISREQSAFAAQSKLSRKDKVNTWLAAAENTWLKQLGEKACVLRYTFGSKPLPLPGQDWNQALNSPEVLNTRFKLTSQPRQPSGRNVVNDPGADSAPPAGSTDLTAALNRASLDAASQSADAVVMVTDGGHNAGSDPREAAVALRGVPLYIVPIGDLEMPRDVVLHHVHCPRVVFKNDNVVLEAMVTAYGYEGEQLHVELMRDKTVVETKTVPIYSKVFDGRLSFEWKATQLGRQALKVRVTPLPGEISLDNNEAQTEVQVVEDTIHVLIADDRPRWEFRYLVGLFKRDKHVEFEQLLFEPNDDSKGEASRPMFPRNLEAWCQYRAVILGDISPGQLSSQQQELLRKYVVEQGGNLIVIGGETAMPAAFARQPLAAMLPIEFGSGERAGAGCALGVTAEGSDSVATQLDDDPLASERIWREMSDRLPIYLPTPARAKPTSHVLINAIPLQGGQPQAFLSWQYVGLGRVVYVAAPSTYQLRYRNGDRYHHRFWGQLLRWAVARDMGGGSKTVRLATDKAAYEKGDSAQIAVHLSDIDGMMVSGGKCGIEARMGERVIKTISLREAPEAPGLYRGTLEDLPQGQLKVRVTGATPEGLLARENYRGSVEQAVVVDPKGSTELSNPLCNLGLLGQIADAADGAVIAPSALQNALSGLKIPPETRQTVLSRQPEWNRWSCLWIFLGCLTLEWIVRKYWRMV